MCGEPHGVDASARCRRERRRQQREGPHEYPARHARCATSWARGVRSAPTDGTRATRSSAGRTPVRRSAPADPPARASAPNGSSSASASRPHVSTSARTRPLGPPSGFRQLSVRQHPARSGRPTSVSQAAGTVSRWRSRRSTALVRPLGVVRSELPRADRRPGPGLARHRGGRPHAAAGADRVGQDPRGVPRRDRPPRLDARPGEGEALPRPLHLAAARPRRRHREEPARPDRRHRARGGAARRRVHAADRRDAHRRHAGQGAPAHRAHAARHPDHHSRVALPDAHVASARDAAQRRDGHRRRDPRARADQARRAPRSLARTARSDRRPRRRNASACRPRSARSTRSRASSAARRPEGPAPGDDRRRGLAQGARHRGDRPGRRHDRARRSGDCAGGRGPRRRPPTRSVSTRPRPTRASGRTCTRASSS